MGLTLRHRVFAFATVVCAACSPAPRPRAGHLTVTDDAGKTVAIAAPATRIFSVLPSLTETITALGGSDLLVARTRFDRQPEVLHLPSLGGTIHPNLEALATLRPDLVISWTEAGQEGIASRVEALGIPVYRAEVQTIEDIYSHLGRLGVLTGHEARAKALVDSLHAALARVALAVRPMEPVDVYYSVWHDPPQTTGPGTFIEQVIEFAGGHNVFHDAPGAWPQVSLEEIVRRDPDVLVIARHEGASVDAPWLTGPGWRELAAVKEGRYLVVDGDFFNRPGPRVAEAALHLARFLHGDSVLEAR